MRCVLVIIVGIEDAGMTKTFASWLFVPYLLFIAKEAYDGSEGAHRVFGFA